MNKQRRKRLEFVRAELEALRDEEREALDALPESFADGEKGQTMDANVDALDSAISSLEEIN